MKRILFLLILISLLSCKTQQNLSAQSKSKLQDITLEDIWQDGTFRTRYMNALHSMQGDYYTVLDFDRKTRSTAIDKYTYRDLQKVERLVSSQDLEAISYFDAYHFNQDEDKLLLVVDSEPIFRRSELAYFYVYDLKTKKTEQVYERKIQEATFSPDGTKVAFAYRNNLYVKDLNDSVITQITHDGEFNSIINGTTDWVYEEEFGFVKAYQWSPDGKSIAFLRFDEFGVEEFSMMQYKEELYPKVTKFKYPKAGEENSKVSLHLYDLEQNRTDQIDLGNYEYIPRIKWTNNTNLLSVQTMNRLQNSLKLFFVDRTNLKAQQILDETSDTYVNVRDVLTFLKNNRFIWSSERDGYQHLYLYNADGTLDNQITTGPWDVMDYYGVDEELNRIFYRSVENGSINKTVYSINLDGSHKKLLSPKHGINRPAFSQNKKYFINNFSDANTPTKYTLYNSEGEQLKELLNNNAVIEKLQHYNIGKKEFSTLTTKNGVFNMWMIKPTDFDPTKKYPVLMYQYSGPGYQTVQNTWHYYDDYWYFMLASKGYIIVSIDGRGTGGKGTNFTKVTYKQLGKYETIDQIEAAKKLGKRPYIDASRIGIWGWSFGGFTSTNAILKGADTFKMAIAVAPVTSWRFYDTVYTERYMQTPQLNPSGYDDNSPLSYAEKLKGNYLLIHGTGDDNVHVQNSMRMLNALIKANVPYDSEFYPDRTHGIYRGQNTRLHLYKRMTKYILENL